MAPIFLKNGWIHFSYHQCVYSLYFMYFIILCMYVYYVHKNSIKCTQIYWFLYVFFLHYFFADNKSILTDSDWKKLWMEAGSINPSSKTDNSIDSSDSPVFDDTEVSLFRTDLTHSIKRLRSQPDAYWAQPTPNARVCIHTYTHSRSHIHCKSRPIRQWNTLFRTNALCVCFVCA